jgi:thiol-disulfide isomerase/thioredoxin
MILQKQNFNSISGTYSKNLDISTVNFMDENGNIINLDDEVLYFDFWSNTCGKCIKKFPDVEKFANDLDDELFYLVNVIGDESEMEIAKKILKDRNVNMKNIFIDRTDVSNFDVYFYPTVIKVDNNEIVFRGMIETLAYFNLDYCWIEIHIKI